MNRDEFDQFFKDHTARYPGFHTWMQTKVPDQEGTYARWVEVMRFAELEDAKTASAKMYESQDEPRGYEKHWPQLAAMARKIRTARSFHERERSRMVDDQETYRCLQCRDVGVLWVWSPASVNFASRKHENPSYPAGAAKDLGETGSLYQCVVACNCAAGKDRQRCLGVVEYDKNEHLPVGMNDGGTITHGAQMSDPGRQARLVAFANKTIDDFGFQPQAGDYESTIAASKEEFE